MNKTEWSKKVQTILERYQAEKVFSHGFAAAGRLGDSFGTKVASAAVLTGNEAIFDLASLTKALVTTPLLYKLKKNGQLSFDDTIAGWLGTLANDLKPEIQRLTIRSLLRHESGLPAWYNFWTCHLSVDAAHDLTTQNFHRRIIEVVNRAGSAINVANPKAQIYSDVGMILLGLGLELKSGKRLNELFLEFCTDELHCDAAAMPIAYGVDLREENQISLSRFVPTAYCHVRRRELRGEVHDENCASLGGVSGNSGLFATGPALVRYLAALSASSVGSLLLKENAGEVVFPLTSPVNASLLGFRQGSDVVAAVFGHGKSIGHYGFPGTAFWIEPNFGPLSTWRFVVLLTNRVFYGRVPIRGQGIALCRKEVFEITQQLTDF
jgi:CubicO group peptidase (beta-lactamase class C family)